MPRIILHLDLDSFYASVEERRNPSIRGKPVVVCMFSGRDPNSGAVATANYEARKLGIKSALSIRQAKSLATKETVFLPADIEYYRKISGRVMSVLRKYADSFEQRSIDEAYLDISACSSYSKAENIAKQIKKEILRKEKLTCSVGIGPNKLIAKMACREQKPDGLTLIRPQEVLPFLSKKPVGKLFGVGPKTLDILQKYNIKTIKDLAACDPEILKKEFGEKKGRLLHDHANGIDTEGVTELERQQLSRIGTLQENTRDFEKIFQRLSILIEDLHRRIKKSGIQFRTISLITVTSGLETKTRSTTLNVPSSDKKTILNHSEVLLRDFLKENPATLRRVGIRVSSFFERKKQKSLSEF